MRTDLIDFVEAAYNVDAPSDTWLKGVLEAAIPIVDDGLGVVSFTYDASNPAALTLGPFASQGMPTEMAEAIAHRVALLEPEFVSKSYLSLSCGTSSEVPGWQQQREAVRASEFGIGDTLVMNGMNPSGQGCLVMAPLGAEQRLTSRRRTLLTKLTCHLAAAHRLRLSTARAAVPTDAQEAVLGYDGTIHHAEGEARSQAALSQLKRSALAITRARGPLRSTDPELAVDEWKGLIAARWTLLDVCEKDGSRYLVARQNQARTSLTRLLTAREEQVVAFATMGHHNKLIAYNLGISHSTVRVLMARAAAKVGARSRDELLRLCLESAARTR